MSALQPMDAATLAARLKRREVTLIDIREADEYAREHIDGAVSMPLSHLEAGRLNLEPAAEIVFHCKSGMRTNTNCDRLAGRVDGAAYMLEGGLDGWKRAGLAVRTNNSAPLDLNRQVQIAVGASALVGALLAALVDRIFIIIPAFFGAGLLFAGVSGWCGMAHLLARAPWNRRAAP